MLMSGVGEKKRVANVDDDEELAPSSEPSETSTLIALPSARATSSRDCRGCRRPPAVTLLGGGMLMLVLSVAALFGTDVGRVATMAISSSSSSSSSSSTASSSVSFSDESSLSRAHTPLSSPRREDEHDPIPPLLASAEKKGKIILTPDLISDEFDEDSGGVRVPEAHERCAYVKDTFKKHNEGVDDKSVLGEMYQVQSSDFNVFYRATAILFWKDFGAGHWGRDQGRSINLDDLVSLRDATYEDGETPMSPMSTWTWTTGDQHLSNFGAWRNRGGEVVFSVNDFDEAAIFDFQIDVLRIAVSICNHGSTNGFDDKALKEALEAFTFTYVDTVLKYVGSDLELLYELTPKTSVGALRDFLVDVAAGTVRHDYMLDKFTLIGNDGVRRFIRDNKTRLGDVDKEMERKIRAEFSPTRYGASMMKMGWCVPGWDDDFFSVLDVAGRVGSGIGSFGVDRFYVLLKGDGRSVILDVKYEPVSAVMTILNETYPDTKAWYDNLFNHEADRAAQGQRRLTSYTDPYVGYLVIDDRPFIVRERSPYKESFDLGTLKNQRVFNEFIEQIAIATATAHTRGTVSKSPGQFKHAIKLLLGGQHKRDRWSKLVAMIAMNYSDQVKLDFDCFKGYIKKNFEQ